MQKTQQKKIELPKMHQIIRVWVKYKRKSLRKLSKRMGKGENYLQQSIRSNDIRPSLLIALSSQLDLNLFEHYLALLPENIRPTEREKVLQKEIESLKTEIENLNKEVKRVEAERDKYWDALSGKR
jgi:hypothetical protein